MVSGGQGHNNVMVRELNYLTVQDLMWVNLQVTKEPQNWDFARLEEGVFLQYGYGESSDLVDQAAQFLTKFATLRPFTLGNEACALIGGIAFLEMNGRGLYLEDSEAVAFYEELVADPRHAREKLTVKLTEHDVETHHGTPDVRGILGEVLARYAESVNHLVKTAPAVPLA